MKQKKNLACQNQDNIRHESLVQIRLNGIYFTRFTYEPDSLDGRIVELSKWVSEQA